MTEQKKKINVDSLMSYASHWSLRLAGSMLVISFAVNNVSQLDDIADAYAKVIVLEAEASAKICPEVGQQIFKRDEELIGRVERLESLAHKPSQRVTK